MVIKLSQLRDIAMGNLLKNIFCMIWRLVLGAWALEDWVLRTRQIMYLKHLKLYLSFLIITVRISSFIRTAVIQRHTCLYLH